MRVPPSSSCTSRSTSIRVLLTAAALAVSSILAAGSASAGDEGAKEESGEKKAEPFAFGDFTWLNGSSRQTEYPLETPAFTGQFMTDANYTYSFAHPKDHTLVGSTTSVISSRLKAHITRLKGSSGSGTDGGRTTFSVAAASVGGGGC